MKKFITLLVLAITTFSFSSFAQQGAVCNPEFSFVVTGTVVQFTPVSQNSQVPLYHNWYFGDNYSDAPTINPRHYYTAPGIYTVKHVVTYYDSSTANTGVFCSDSVTRQVVIADQPICDIHADFSISEDSLQPNKFYFTNQSAGTNPNTVATWSFGDGTNSYGNDPYHIYTSSGDFTVCLTVSSDSLCTDDTCTTVRVMLPTTACNLVAGFDASADSLHPNIIHFTNHSTPADPTDSVRYTFGDGTSSFDANPSHTYTAAGNYTVCIRVKKVTQPGVAACVREFCRTVVIQLPTVCNLHSNFNFVRDSLQTNKVYFSNLSAGTTPNTVVHWSFGDGTGSYDNSPAHIYAAPGAYTVCLTVRRDSLCSDDTCRIVQVQVPNSCNLIVDFAWHADSSNNALIYFNNLSAPLNSTDSVTWTFGDGSSSHDLNPHHTYTSSLATFNVCLTVKKNNVLSCAGYICHPVVVQQSCNLQADYTYYKDSTPGLALNTYHFQNTSIPAGAADSLFWNFGDGSAIVVNRNDPTHVFTTAGTYTVCLTIKKIAALGAAPCERHICRVISVQAACNLTAGYSWYADSVRPTKIYFTNTTIPPSTAASATWYFGDGTSSNGWNADHIYAQPGMYAVCLRVEASPNCVSYQCDSITVSGSSACNLHAHFSFVRDRVQTNKVYFTNLSDGITPNTIVHWSFGDGASSNDNSPSHTYTASGTFTVCLYLQRDSFCTDDTCAMVQIQLPANNCNLIVNFSSQPDSLHPNTIHFTNLTAPFAATDSISWTFGDGAYSSDINPTHTYAAGGTYTVCLAVKKMGVIGTAPCVREYCHAVIIQALPCNLTAYFAMQADSSNPRLIHFTNLSSPLNAMDSVSWTFGDGSRSADLNPSHTYDQPGTYTVCIRVKKAAQAGAPDCVSEYCKQLVIQQQPACTLVANFSFSQDSTFNNAIFYHFFNTSTPLSAADSSFWNFGDGTPAVVNSNTELVHVYTTPGVYVVCLRVKKAQTSSTNITCERQTCQTIVIPAPCDITPDFSYYFDTANQSVRYHFSNNSQPLNAIDSSFWNFGDGSFSHDSNPQHIFPAPGTYVVCLTVKRRIAGSTIACERQVCKTIIVPSLQPATCNLSVNFSSRNDSVNNRKIFFNNLSTPTSSNALTLWTFGDGTSSTGWNADHLYGQPGQYIVCLKVSLTNTCIRDTCITITVQGIPQDSCNTQVGFTTHIDSANRKKVYFTNTTATPAAAVFATWNFGDGTSGTGWNADHVYAQSGWYNVCLTVVRGNACTRIKCDSVFVPGSTIPPVNCDSLHVGYVYRRDAYMPSKLFFFATSNGPLLHQSWTFSKVSGGTPITVNQNDPVHVFEDTGTYIVCLNAVLSGGCVKEHCTMINIHNTTIPSRCILQSYPNPARNHVSVNLQLQQPELITASVYNAQNVLMIQHTQQGFTGNNLVTVNIQNLVSGFYTIRLVYGNRACYTRFQKLRGF